MKHRSPAGVFDIVPTSPKEEWRETHRWLYLEAVIREVTELFTFQEIRTPLFERTELFQKSTGETSDIVTKEMYTFEDKGKRSMTLRPEGTPSVLRALIEHQLTSVQKLYYIAPMFRYERPQAGRYRQHHQFGAEVIGYAAPEQDAELIDMVMTLYKRLGIKNLHVSLNSIGDLGTRARYKEALCSYLKLHFDELSEDSQRRFTTNPMRILDSKSAQDIAITAKAPSILDFLSEDTAAHFEKVQEYLTALEIPYTLNPFLVRGLDYYDNTVFEIISNDLGAQNSIGGGGRYNGLIKQMGGADTPAIGFATGMERILQVMLAQNVPFPDKAGPELFLIALGDQAKAPCMHILRHLRSEGISVEMDFSGKKLQKVMQYANLRGSRHVAVIGDNELAEDRVNLKIMETGESIATPLSELAKHLQKNNPEPVKQ
jgi:histidyl-tRNA synthetase